MSVHIEAVEPNTVLTKLLYKDFSSILNPAHVFAGKDKVCVPAKYKDLSEDIINFDVRDDDIFLISYPKTGTSWLQEMVWILVHELDKEENQAKIKATSPYLEIGCIYDYQEVLKKNPDLDLPYHVVHSIEFTKNHPLTPRVIKTHLPWSLLPKQIQENIKKPKIIYVARNAKDNLVSYYHHEVNLSDHKGSIEDFTKLYTAGLTKYGNYISHIKSIWPHKNDPNFLFITYEEMKADLPAVIEKVSRFIGKPLLRDNPRMAVITELLSFEKMKTHIFSNNRTHSPFNRLFYTNNKTDKFFRRGIVGSHKTELSEDIIQTIDEWILENTKDNQELRQILF